MGETESVDEDGLNVGVLLVDQNLVFFLVENRSKTRMIDFKDLLKDNKSTYEIKITDEFGNKYSFSGFGHPARHEVLFSLRPGDFWVFGQWIEPPVERAKYLYMEVPPRMLGNRKGFSLKVPITRETLDYNPPVGYSRQRAGKRSKEVLFKRDDFETWFSKWKKRGS
jgi:hypothetical protein